MKFVRGVYAEFKRRGSPTVVMGASFRSTAQIEALAGCDRLTISPDLLEKLDADHGELPRKLVAGAAEGAAVTPIDAAKFAADLAADPMATEKLATGIEAFARIWKHCASGSARHCEDYCQRLSPSWQVGWSRKA